MFIHRVSMLTAWRPPLVGVEEGHDFDREYLRIKGIHVLEVGVPSHIHRGKEELS